MGRTVSISISILCIYSEWYLRKKRLSFSLEYETHATPICYVKQPRVENSITYASLTDLCLLLDIADNPTMMALAQKYWEFDDDERKHMKKAEGMRQNNKDSYFDNY